MASLVAVIRQELLLPQSTLEHGLVVAVQPGHPNRTLVTDAQGLVGGGDHTRALVAAGDLAHASSIQAWPTRRYPWLQMHRASLAAVTTQEPWLLQVTWRMHLQYKPGPLDGILGYRCTRPHWQL